MDEEESKDLVITVSMQLSGLYTGELPKLEPLRRKLWNFAEDKGKYSVDEFEFNVAKAEIVEELEDKDDT